VRGHTDPKTAADFWARIFVLLLGLGAVAWGALLLPMFWQQQEPDRVVSQIVQGQAFKSETLLAVAARAEAVGEWGSLCNPAALHDAAVLRLAIFNDAVVAADHRLTDSDYGPVAAASRRALSCAPADPLVWLTLFWVDAGAYGLAPYNANYLRLSYALGPYEGWIALWRTRIAVAMLDRLPPDLSELATTEFVNLVNTGRLYQQTAQIFARASPAAQGRIIDGLKAATEIARQNFARTLYDRGLDVQIPNTEIPGLRSWER
jgi:hypothetical protein